MTVTPEYERRKRERDVQDAIRLAEIYGMTPAQIKALTYYGRRRQSAKYRRTARAMNPVKPT